MQRVNTWDISQYYKFKEYYLTSSDVAIICTFLQRPIRRKASYTGKLQKVCYQRTSMAKFRGLNDNIEQGLERYGNTHGGVLIERGSMKLSRTIPFLAANIHGQITADRILYVMKLPHNLVHDPRHKIDTLFDPRTNELKVTSGIYLEVQAKMAVAEANSCVVFFCAENDYEEYIVNFDAAHWDLCTQVLREFQNFKMLEILHSRKKRGMDLRSYENVSALIETNNWEQWPPLVYYSLNFLYICK